MRLTPTQKTRIEPVRARLLVACAVMIGAGTMIASHVNDSGWWVSQSMLNMDMTRTFKYNTLVGGVAGVIAGIVGAIFITVGAM